MVRKKQIQYKYLCEFAGTETQTPLLARSKIGIKMQMNFVWRKCVPSKVNMVTETNRKLHAKIQWNVIFPYANSTSHIGIYDGKRSTYVSVESI